MDFGATDGPMNESQIAAVNGNVLHVPTVLGAVVVTYNLPALGDTQLKFDGNALVDIFMGRITKWNDQRIAALNPGVKLPDQDIIVVHRSDGSGTTYIFTDYLNKFSPRVEGQGRLRARRSTGRSGLGGKGNEGVTQQVKQTEGAHRLRRADLRPVEQAAVRPRSRTRPASSSTPSLESVTAAAAARQARAGHRFPGLDHQRARRRGLPDRLVHLAAGVPKDRRTRPRPRRSRISSSG